MDLGVFKPITEELFNIGDIRYVAEINDGELEWIGVGIFSTELRFNVMKVILVRSVDGSYVVLDEPIIPVDAMPTHYDSVNHVPI